MMDLADLLSHSLSRLPIQHNEEAWYVVSVVPCAQDPCAQRMRGKTCAGVVGLVNAEDSQYDLMDMHAEASLATPEPERESL